MEDAYGSSSWNSWSMGYEDLVLQIGNLKTGKEIWEVIKTRNLGVDRVKEVRLQTLVTEFENLKMLHNGTIDEYAKKLSGIASKSATLGEVMSELKLVNKFLTSLPKCFFYIVAALEQVLDLKTTGFEDVIGRLKAYEERVKEEDRANDPQENFFMLGLNIPTGIMTQVKEEDVAHTLEIVDEVEVKDVVGTTRKTKCYRYDQYGHFVSKCPKQNQNHEVNLNEIQEKEKYTPPKSESNTDDKDDVWFGDGSCVSIKGKGSILFQGENCEHKLLKDDYYISALRSNVISLRQATIFGYDISIRAGKGWKIHHLNVKMNFLNVDRKKLDSTLKEMGFLQCMHEKAVYRKVPNKEFIIVAVNKDDIFMTGTSLDLINKFKRIMASQFEMSDLGLKLSKAKDKPEVEATQYRKMVSCLHYLLHTRPDLTYSVGVISRYMQSPRESHARTIKKILRYLKGTTSFRIKYKWGNDMRLVGYNGHNVDIDDGRSTTGHVFYLGTSPITWFFWVKGFLGKCITLKKRFNTKDVGESHTSARYKGKKVNITSTTTP
ncbi:uncharacterized mitochondrial protein-like protein [Tanacetum coccineum]|uniref:Uncharacterized mitochondrial protein-like protein n=1 Tax=Tanacetum coccineum TaxID=301880 RepID=A0ABQ5B1W5_9ASTR